jgi:hypothetical protein
LLTRFSRFQTTVGALWRRLYTQVASRHIAKFVRDCTVCQLRSAINRQIKTHCFTTASCTPMEVLNIDTIGPVDRDSANSCYILVVIDCFTRFVELYPVGDTSALLSHVHVHVTWLSCARALLSHVCRYGTPMTIRFDRETQFVNGIIIRELLSLLQVEHEVSLAYSKEHNAIVERANKEVVRHLTAIIFDKRVSEAWSTDYLPLVQRIMNAKVHDTIGVSPAELLFGQAINLYSGLLSDITPESLIRGLDDSASGRLSEHVAKLVKAQRTLIEVARNNQLATDSHHMREALRFSHLFPVNSYILYRPPDNSRSKTQVPKACPYIVMSILGDKYFIQALLTHKVIDTHASNLSEFRYDSSSGLNPIEVAARNAGKFFFEKILDHTDNVRQRSKMTLFRARWKGQTPDDDAWQPIKTVRETQAFVDYCKEKKLSSLVSKRLKFSLARIVYRYLALGYNKSILSQKRQVEHWNLMQDSLLFLGV